MKTITMKKTLSLAFASSLVILTACGDDITNNEVLKAESYTTKEDLPDCGEKYEGKFATIPSKGEVYVCADGKWKTLLSKAASTISDDGEFACSTVELSSGKGYKVVCGGDSVAVVTNGAKGATGDKGPTGSTGAPGEDGDPGTSGSDGKDLSLKAGDCAVMNYGTDYMVYDCGDSVYVRTRSMANFYTWNAIEAAIETDYGDLWSYDADSWLGHWSSLYNDRFSTKAKGSMERWEGDKSWVNGDAWNLGIVADYYAYEGKALLTLTEDVETSIGDYRPYVGIRIAFSAMSASDYGGTAGDDQGTYSSHYSVALWGGVCLTYRSETEMNVILKNAGKFIMASVPASKDKDATVNIGASAFTALEGASYTAEDVIDYVDTITVELLGSNKKGEYTNTFALYELGAYGHCTGYTKNVVPAEIKARKGKTGSFKDPRDGKTYKTITIGDQTWFAENLDYDYKVHVNEADDALDPDFECVSGDPDPTKNHPCVEGLVYEYADEDQAKLFGRLYSWAAAIDSASLARAESPLTCGKGTTCSLPAKVQGICPEGWRLPSRKEMQKLNDAACDSMFKRLCFTQEAAYSTSGWKNEADAGEDWLGISLYPTGYYAYSKETPKEWSVGSSVYVWTATEYSAAYAYHSDGWYVGSSSIKKEDATAVRCIQDEAK